MQITLQNTGKRYNREWIFRHVNYEFNPGTAYAITGPNGSGKSTLLQVIAGAVLHSEGKILYQAPKENKLEEVSDAEAYKYISIATPYLELIEELTATEFLNFHATFKVFTTTIPDMLDAVGLPHAANKQIRYFSSGMKQRLKLAQAFFSQSTVILLDEPSSNLDADGIALYKKLIREHSSNKLVIVGSNDEDEYNFCSAILSIKDFK